MPPKNPPRTVARRFVEEQPPYLAVLCVSLLLAALGVWQLRQTPPSQSWPWLILVISAFVAAAMLHRVGSRFPARTLPLRSAPHAGQQQRRYGFACLIAAGVITILIVAYLVPDRGRWQSAPFMWLVAMLLAMIGAVLLRGIGGASAGPWTAIGQWPPTRRNGWLAAAAFLLIMALAVLLRTYRLDVIPPGIYVDETNAALDALYILEGRSASPFGTGWYGTPNGYLYYMALLFQWFGANWTALKLASLIPAILTVPAVYLLGRELFGPLTGLIGMFLLAVSRWHLSMSRWGWNETAPPLFHVLGMYFLARGLRERRAWHYALSGLLMGISTYTYVGARLCILIWAVYAIYWIASDPAGPRAALRRSGQGILLMAVVAVMVVAPIGVTYIMDPFSFGNRVSEISIFRDITNAGTPAPLIDNLLDILKFFHQTGDLQGKHNLPGEPMMDPLTGLFFVVGLAYALLGWRDRRHFMLVLWLIIGLAGSYLSSNHESPQSYRALNALPAAILLAAIGLAHSARAIHAVSGGARTGRGPAGGRRSTFLAGLLVVPVLAGAGLWETSVYFGRQARSPAVTAGFNLTENRVAHETVAALASGKTVYLSPGLARFSPVRFLAYGYVKERTGKNTLDDPPYREILPASALPLPAETQDVVVLLESQYWPTRDFFTAFYPQARAELVLAADQGPLFMRLDIPGSQVQALGGLHETLIYADGRRQEALADQVELSAESAALVAEWNGALRLDQSGLYAFPANGRLRVFVDGQEWSGTHYLGAGLYKFYVQSPAGSAGTAGLLWQVDDAPAEPLPARVLFTTAGSVQGLLGEYWENTEWDGDPLFRQLTPFLLLAWPDGMLPTSEFSARFSGILRVPTTGTIEFRVEADDGARILLDGNVLGEGMVPNRPNNFQASAPLAAGDHRIQIDYIQNGGGNALRIYWRMNGGPFELIPPSALAPPAWWSTAPPALESTAP